MPSTLSGASEGQAPVMGIGAEVRAWVTNDDAVLIARVLREFEQSTPRISPAEREAWSRAGFRLLLINRAALKEIQAALTPTPGQWGLSELKPGQRLSSAPAAVTRQWIAQGSSWIEAARGPFREEAMIVALQDSRLTLGGGTLRLLTRCWAVPVPSDQGVRAELRVQMVPQHEPRTIAGGDDDRFAAALEKAAIARGTAPQRPSAQTFDRLLLTAALRDDEVLLIVPEQATRNWTSVIEQAESSAMQAEAVDESKPAPRPEPAGPGQVKRDSAPGVDANAGEESKPPTTATDTPRVRGIGPGQDAAVIPTLGEAMLIASGGGGGVRLMLAIVPGFPDGVAAPGNTSAAPTPAK
ncbi:MAG: hypothetical protein IBJ18_02710 [Phycisphaerales bacterium]|nr:hypothetical protein [Phycisphaerales bacterium]